MSKLSTKNLFWLINNHHEIIAIRDPYDKLAVTLGRLWGHKIELPDGGVIWGYL